MKHIVSGIFICEVQGDTRKEVIEETHKSILDGKATLHIMEVEDGREKRSYYKTVN